MTTMLDRMATWMASLHPWDGADASWVAYKRNIARATESPVAPWQFYQVLRAYYDNSGVYDQIRSTLGNVVGDRYRDMHGLRNPAMRITEFYVAHLWPGPLYRALPIAVEDDTERLLEPINTIWNWSNWGRLKQPAARTFAMLGDLFIKVVGDADAGRVYFETLDPGEVVEFDEDARGYLTYARLDIPRTRRVGGKPEDYVYTETWSKDEMRFRRWEHKHPIGVEIEQLGEPLPEDDLDMAGAFGIDFVPIVHAPFRDMGQRRGIGSFTLGIDKIDEVNRKASRLGQQLFRHNDDTWVMESSNPGNAGDRSRVPPGIADVNALQIGGQRILGIPAGWTLRSQIPEINYQASLDAIAADLAELQQDFPEMAYWRITETAGGDLSGRAIRFMLGPAITRAEEARGNGEEALVRADMMGLTIAQNLGLDGFAPRQIGTYDRGDFWHEFEEREIIPQTPAEEAEEEGIDLTNLTLKQVIGVPNLQLQAEAGYTEDEIAGFQEMAGVDGLGNALLNNLENGGQNPLEGNPDDQPIVDGENGDGTGE